MSDSADDGTAVGQPSAKPSDSGAGHGGDGKKPAKKSLPFWQEFPLLVLIAIVLALVIKTFLFQAFYIPSGSMENTLHVRDRVLVNKVTYDFRQPHRGEIVVFNAEEWQPEVVAGPSGNPVQRGLRAVASAVGVGPPGENDYIKRVVGLPGDTVQCCDPQGRVTVNSKPLNEPYIFQDTPREVRGFGPITVPAGRLWVMGDHRGGSQDSRAHRTDRWHGTIPQDHVIGRAFVIVWPVGRAGRLGIPAGLVGAAVLTLPVLPPLPATLRPGRPRPPRRRR